MNKNIKIGLIVLASLILLALIIVALTGKEGAVVLKPGGPKVPEEMKETQSPEGAQETQKIIDEIIDSKGGSEDGVVEISIPSGEIGEDGEEITKSIKAVEVAAGNNLIDVNTGEVIRRDGTKVDNAAAPASQGAPSQSYPMENADSLPSSAVKLEVTSTSFSPNTFTVERGQAVIIAVTNVNESTFSEIFRFDDPSLSGIVIGLAKGETKSVTFNAPTQAGEYTFYSSMFDHRELGAEGVMIVR